MPMAGERHLGWVRSFRGTWGFLNGEGFDGDLFVGLKGNPHLTILAQDDQVEFEVKIDDKGKAEAVNVVVVGQKPPTGMAETGAGAAAQQAPAGTRYKGWVRSFTGSWGFVNSDAFPGDLFVGLRSNPHLATLAAGDKVEFEIKCNGSGKNEAVAVQPEQQLLSTASTLLTGVRPMPPMAAAPAAAPAARTGPAERAQVPHLVGQTINGRIKSFRDNWGFVNSDFFVGDLFIHLRSNADLGPVGPGDPIQFEVAEDPTSSSGEYHAVGAVLMKDDVHNLVGATVRGWVKSFKDSWGLLNSNRFDGDVFVGVRANPQIGMNGLQQGKCVEFQIARDEKSSNGIQAVQVKQLGETVQQPLLTPTLTATAPLTALPRTDPVVGFAAPKPGPESFVGLRAGGVVRSFREGWGFVVSDDFDGDLFLHQGSNPGLGALNAGDPISFEISLGSSGKCHATKVQAVPTELKDLVGRQCSGRVRSFHDTWGFVTSHKYPGDLFVGMRSNPHLTVPLKLGDNVEFTVQRSAGNKSQTGFEAVNVKVEGSGSTTLPATPKGAPVSAPSVARGLAEARSRSPRPVMLGTLGQPALGAPPNAPGALGGRSPANAVGSILNGWVRSFRGSWGFAQADAFDGDLFIGAKSNAHLPREPAAGDQIQFRVSQGSGGKLEAVDVSFL